MSCKTSGDTNERAGNGVDSSPGHKQKTGPSQNSTGSPREPTCPNPWKITRTEADGERPYKRSTPNSTPPRRQKPASFTRLWALQARAARATGCLTCNATELRDLIRDTPTGRAGGPDGIPSQCIKALGFQTVKQIASLFTTLLNDPAYLSEHRPSIWQEATAILLPKEPQAVSLDRFCPISLMANAMAHLQKLFGKWLVCQAAPILDQNLPETQWGYRRGRQPAEILHVIARLVELRCEWSEHMTLIKIDLRKAFDSISQSSILHMLLESDLDPRLSFSLARELVGGYLRPEAYGCQAPEPVPQRSGTKQGAPESGMLFVSTLERHLSPLRLRWQEQKYGIRIDHEQLAQVSFVDDMILVAASSKQGLKMLKDVEATLAQIGLKLNTGKTSYISSMPNRAECLPGSNENATGILIMGRRFRFGDNTDSEIAQRTAVAWQKFHRLRHILGAATLLAHRLKIYRACIVQSILWGASSWHIMRRRCQKLRGTELHMMRTLVRCPQHLKDCDSAIKFSGWNTHIYQTLWDHGCPRIDEIWIKRWQGWAGHLARLDACRWAVRTQQHKDISWWKKTRRDPRRFQAFRAPRQRF